MRAFLARWSAIAALLAGVAASGTVAVMAGRHRPGASPQAGPVTRTVSVNWVGYAFSVRDVTGIRADWTEPFVIPVGPSSAESIWIGVGGFGSTDIMQAGTSVFYFGIYGDQEAWYERWPLDKLQVNTGFIVFPPDLIRVMLTQVAGSAHEWRVWVKTSSGVWTRTATFDTSLRGPEFVVEDPGQGSIGSLFTFAHWASVTFRHMEIRVGNSWFPAGEFPGVRIDMIRDGTTIATAGPLRGGTSFTAKQP